MNFRLCLPLFLCLSWGNVSAQSDPPKPLEDKAFEQYDLHKSPDFPGGQAALTRYLETALQYPSQARGNSVEGTVVLQFLVGKDSSIRDIKVLRDIGSGCGKEAIRMVSAMPKWIPGEVSGMPVNAWFTLPIRFKLGSKTPEPTPTNPYPGKLSQTEIWTYVSKSFKATCLFEAEPTPETAFKPKTALGSQLLTNLEETFQTKFSEADKKSFKSLGKLADFCFQSQFAPVFYGKTNLKGRDIKLSSNRANFDMNADGLGTIGSLKVPEGVKVTLYSKKKFKGKKLIIEAPAPFEIPDMSAIPTNDLYLKNQAPDVNWGLNTQSIKVELPKEIAGK